MKTCSNCKFWQRAPDVKYVWEGFCYRYPPTLMATRKLFRTTYDSFWPDAASVEWCGEHQPKEESDER